MILDQIIADKKIELNARKRAIPLFEVQKEVSRQKPALDFAAALKGPKLKLIAEIKRASPSRGIIRDDFDPVEIAKIYSANGASAISVLTEARYFQGGLSFIPDIKSALGDKIIPLLRKDFLTDPYQIYESRANAADALLLIAAILKPAQLKELYELTTKLGMATLVEVHNETELKIALDSGAKIIGINNRDLTTFETDLSVTERLRPLVPNNKIVVSESGIKDHNDMEKMQKLGVNAVLIGEALMSVKNIAARMKELL
jgi:indole-3-glycerol phosphate synthase